MHILKLVYALNRGVLMSNESTKQELTHDVEMFNKYRNLLGELTKKNIKLKYRNSWLGVFWSFLEPLLNMAVLCVVFGGMFGRNAKGIACYPVWMFSGRLLYEFFNTSTKQAMTSFRRNAAIIKKVYVPKYMYPISSIFSSFVNLGISLLCYIAVWIFFKVTGLQGGHDITITWRALLFFIPLIIILLFSTGIGLMLSVLSVYFKDIEYIWQVFTRLLFYMVPIIYPISKITTPWIIKVIQINPLYSMIELFRQCVIFGTPMDPIFLLKSVLFAVLSLVLGIVIFNWKSDDLVFHL